MRINKINFLIGIVLLVGLMIGTGCATKKYVLGEVATIDQKVEGVETAVEENQKRIQEHDGRLATLGSLIKQQEAEMKKQTTQFDSYELSDDAKAMLDEFVQFLIEQDKGVYLEIQGHTDSTGPESWNLILGEKRAEAVMEYLHKKYNIPLHRMEVISYGSEQPVGDNSTREGRAQNRRVAILVFE
jgi:outer membrane protein OmpA-like peptidoglycan-associated protein